MEAEVDGADKAERGVVIGTDVHPAAVAGQIMDAEGYRRLDVGADEAEAVVLHLHRIAASILITGCPPA
jgi:hypothetical protein